MSSSNHSIIVPSDSDIEDAFSFTKVPNYFPATSGNTSPDSSNDLTKYLLATLVFSPLHDDPYMEIMQAYYVWQERNWRLFQKGKRSIDQVVECIKSVVRLKLLSCKLKKSKSGERLAKLWDLPEAVFVSLCFGSIAYAPLGGSFLLVLLVM
ncbi:hypothetical protein Tco_0325810 [Tanacetum coccineum]